MIAANPRILSCPTLLCFASNWLRLHPVLAKQTSNHVLACSALQIAELWLASWPASQHQPAGGQQASSGQHARMLACKARFLARRAKISQIYYSCTLTWTKKKGLEEHSRTRNSEPKEAPDSRERYCWFLLLVQTGVHKKGKKSNNKRASEEKEEERWNLSWVISF